MEFTFKKSPEFEKSNEYKLLKDLISLGTMNFLKTLLLKKVIKDGNFHRVDYYVTLLKPKLPEFKEYILEEFFANRTQLHFSYVGDIMTKNQLKEYLQSILKDSNEIEDVITSFPPGKSKFKILADYIVSNDVEFAEFDDLVDERVTTIPNLTKLQGLHLVGNIYMLGGDMKSVLNLLNNGVVKKQELFPIFFVFWLFFRNLVNKFQTPILYSISFISHLYIHDF